jgi:hypothetical protein
VDVPNPAPGRVPGSSATGLAGLVGRGVAWVVDAVQLGSDRGRAGQQAFTASPFNRLALTHVLSMAGDALVTLALAGSLFFNISPHAARGRVALSLILTMAPFAIVAPFLGPAIDRTRGGRRLMVLLTAWARALACLMMARYIHGLLLFPAAFVALVCSKGYTVAKAALVPRVVERPDDLIEANAKLAVSGAVVGFLAAIPGVAILKLLSAATLLRVDAGVYVLCGVCALRIRSARPAGADLPAGAGTDTGHAPASNEPAPDVPLSDQPLPPGVLQLAAVAVGSLRFAVGFVTFLVAFAFRRQHTAAWWFGLVLAASLGGNLLGAALAPKLRGRVREERLLAGSVGAVAATGLIVMQFTAFHAAPAAAMLAAVLGIGAASGKLAFDSMVQREVPPSAQGRAFARFEAVFQLVWVFGGLVPVVFAMPLSAGFVTCTVVTGGALLVYEAGSWLGRRDRLPGWWPGVAPAHRWPTAVGVPGGVAGGVGLADTAPGPGLDVAGDGGGGPWGGGIPGVGRDAIAGGLSAPDAEPPGFGPAPPGSVPPPLSGAPPRPGLDQ